MRSSFFLRGISKKEGKNHTSKESHTFVRTIFKNSFGKGDKAFPSCPSLCLPPSLPATVYSFRKEGKHDLVSPSLCDCPPLVLVHDNNNSLRYKEPFAFSYIPSIHLTPLRSSVLSSYFVRARSTRTNQGWIPCLCPCPCPCRA